MAVCSVGHHHPRSTSNSNIGSELRKNRDAILFPIKSNGYRSFTPAAIERLQHLKHARAQGYTVAELRHLTTAYDAGRLDAHERRAFLTGKIAKIARQIASLEEMRSTFERELSLLGHAE
jgi:DNA-binding transcriptional MerR regulator